MSNLNINGSLRCNNQIFNGTTSMASSLYVLGLTILFKKNTLLLSLNHSAKTIMGSNIYDFDHSNFRINKYLIITNNVTNGSRIKTDIYDNRVL